MENYIMKEQVKNTENVVYMDINCLNSKESGLLYFKLPQFLMTAKFAKLSSDGKVVYSAMLNRLPLSVRNGWKLDNLFYIYFSMNTVMKLIHCSKSKAVRVMKELKEFNLIEGRRCSDHRKMRYFFLDVSEYITEREVCYETGSDEEIEHDSVQEEGGNVPAGANSEPEWFEKETSTGVKNELEQVSNSVPKKTDSLRKTDSQKDHLHKEQNHVQKSTQRERKWRRSKEQLKEDFTLMWKGGEGEAELLYSQNELLQLDKLIDTVASALSRRYEFKINGLQVRLEDVYLRLMGLGYDEISYVLDYLFNSNYQCRNFSAYTVSVLYNALEEAEQYWMNKVRHDEYQNQRYGKNGGYYYGYAV
jgi:hypothetical protein